MACYHPLKAWRHSPGPGGKASISFRQTRNWSGEQIELPCGRCIGCRLERSRQWAMRCVHEASLYKENRFLTLTYDNEHVPPDWSVDVREVQLFMKKLRKVYAGVRYFFCGEYGELCKNCGLSRVECSSKGCQTFVRGLGRPHYHSIMFNLSFGDEYVWSRNNGLDSFRSPTLEKLWGKGHCVIGQVTFQSAAYVARYCVKKITGDESEDHYEGKNSEFVVMSRRPGIGAGWYSKYKTDVFPSDSVIVQGKEVKPPRYYLAKLEVESPSEHDLVKERRLAFAQANELDNRPARLLVKESVKLQSLLKLKRPLEVTQ